MKTLRFVCSQLFCDFGEEFEVLDKDGETPASAMIQGITQVTPFFVLCYWQQKSRKQIQ